MAQRKERRRKDKEVQDRGEAVDYVQTAVYIRPPDQLTDLTTEQLNELFTRQLTRFNPNVNMDQVVFSFSKRKFCKELEDGDHVHTVPHVAIESIIFGDKSEDAENQQRQQDAIKERMDAERNEGLETGLDETLTATALSNPNRSRFKTVERSAQTTQIQYRDRGMNTEPPPVRHFSAQATSAEIYDAYVTELEQKNATRERKEAKAALGSANEDDGIALLTGQTRKTEEVVDQSRQTNLAKYHALKVLERMVSENIHHEIAIDYKFWEDPADTVRGTDGVLMPLWKFVPEVASGRLQVRGDVTSICANPVYEDLIAVGYGSFDFMNQTNGHIYIYTYKNPAAPEYHFTTEAGVMSLQFHPTNHSLLAVGLYNGQVLVYDVRERGNRPVLASTARNGKHSDPVWQVSWQIEELSKQLSFFSISSDGRVTLWTMSKNELQFMDVIYLHLARMNKELTIDQETSLLGQEGGSCFDFHHTIDHLFVVGTEDGKIHKCSKAYTSQYLETFEGHFMAVYAVRWSNFHPKIFISCSADWTVRVWDHNNKLPLMTMDLDCEVGDVAWAPYSSTVFAAITADGKLHIYDLAENTNRHICCQKIVNKAKPTRIAFSPTEPIIFVGDSAGHVTVFKLSPNLRKSLGRTTPQLEIEKLERVLAQESVDTKGKASTT